MVSSASPCTSRASTAFSISISTAATTTRSSRYGDVFLQAEQEYSRFNFEHADTAILFAALPRRREGVQALLEKGQSGDKHLLALPAYDQCIKASHVFNLLDARGVISVTERQSYILRVRDLAQRHAARAWLATEGGRA